MTGQITTRATSRVRSVPSAPVLSEAVIVGELERVFARERRSSLLALFGTGEPRTVVAARKSFQVLPTRSELELRGHLAACELGDERRVFLVDWARSLPLDIACRLAGGRLYTISRDTRLAALFDARDIDPRLYDSALAARLLEGDRWRDRLPKATGQMLGQGDAYASFLSALTDDDYSATDAGSLVDFLCFCIQAKSGESVSAELRGEHGARLREELLEFVVDRHGGADERSRALARAAFRAYLAGQGQDFARHLVLLWELARDPANPDAAQAHAFVGGMLRGSPFGPDLIRAVPQVGPSRTDDDQATDLVDDMDLSRTLSKRLGWGERVFSQIEELLAERASAALSGSVILPAGLRARQRRLADALADVAGERDATRLGDRMADARRAHEAVAAHQLSADGGAYQGDRRLRDMGLRLAAFVADATIADAIDRARDKPASVAASQPCIDWATWYAREGGHIDWVRQYVHMQARGPYAEALRQLLERADDVRQARDRAFAEGLVAWLEHGQPSSRVLPIDKASERLVANFLAEAEHRKLLVVLMDGMNMADAVQLCSSAARTRAQWQPVTWMNDQMGGQLGGAMAPVLAAMPTITNVSRAAFFAGAQGRLFGDESTGYDRKRWQENRALSRVLSEVEPVMLKSEVADGGRASEAVLARLQDDAQRLVAVVVNALDDQNKGSEQLHLQYDLEHIPLLRALLEAADETERAVLLIADHGHVPGNRLRSMGRRPGTGSQKSEGGARWRALEPGDEPAAYEVALGGKAVWTPRGHQRVAVIWDETRCYGKPGHGEHGGASLAEVMCPAVLLAPENLNEVAQVGGDRGLRTHPLRAPDWWYFEVRDHRPAVEKPRLRRVPASAPPAQTELFAPVADARPQQATPPSAPVAGSGQPVLRADHDRTGTARPNDARSGLLDAVAGSRLFKAQSQDEPGARVAQGLRVLGLLLDAGGRMKNEVLARRLGVPSFRVNGPIQAMERLFNLDDIAVVERDTRAGEVHVHIDLLKQLFEVVDERG